jgi:hypothetical protein
MPIKRAMLTLLLFSSNAGAQGVYGTDHDVWHDFYVTLKRPNTTMPCCNDHDCRSTISRRKGDHYEIMVDGFWFAVSQDVIIDVVAPDGGAHVCAPPYSQGDLFGTIYCVILPPDS